MCQWSDVDIVLDQVYFLVGGIEREGGSGKSSTLCKGKDWNACAGVDWERKAECVVNTFNQAAEP